MWGDLDSAQYICCTVPALRSSADLNWLYTEPALTLPIQGMINPPGFDYKWLIRLG